MAPCRVILIFVLSLLAAGCSHKSTTPRRKTVTKPPLSESVTKIDHGRCLGASLSQCEKWPECEPVRGPSSCSGGVCTADVVYKRCEKRLPAKR